MKKYYLFTGAIILSGIVQSQPVLTYANNAVQVGESYVYTQIDWNGTAPSSGANQTWNYSVLTINGVVSLDMVDPATCPSPSSFTAANVGWNYGSGAQYDFSNYNSTAHERVGQYVGGVAMPLSNSEKMLSYPFAYTNTFVDPFSGTFVNGITWNRIGEVTVTAIGYGTLILPNVTLTDLLCVKVTEDYGDWDGGTETYHYNIDIYMFYKPGIHVPVLALTHYQQGATIINYANFIDDATLGENENLTNTISVYPNPVSNELNINSNSIFDKIEVFDVAGTLVFTSAEQINTINVEKFKSGIYFLHLWEGEKRETIKFVKE